MTLLEQIEKQLSDLPGENTLLSVRGRIATLTRSSIGKTCARMGHLMIAVFVIDSAVTISFL